MPNLAKITGAFVPALLILAGSAAAMPLQAASPAPIAAPAEGIIRLKSANGFDETIARLKADVAGKGVRLFDLIDQAALGAQAGLKTGRSTLVIFGNPPLGVQFIQANPYAGIDWPVRMLVTEEADGTVWVAWTDFATVARRYRIDTLAPQFRMASEVAASIATAATTR